MYIRITGVTLLIFFFLAGCGVSTPPPTQPLPQETAPAVAQPTTVAQETPLAVEPTHAPATVEPTQAPTNSPSSAPTGWVASIGPDGNIWLTGVSDGKMRQVTADAASFQDGGEKLVDYSQPQWSSDGQFLAYQRSEGTPYSDGMRFTFSTGIYDIQAGETRMVLEGQQTTGFAWRPGTHLLAYGVPLLEDYFSGRGVIRPGAAQGIWALDLDTNAAPFELVKPENGRSLVNPHWSPDGKFVGFDEVAYYEGRGDFAYYDFEAQKYVAWGGQVGNYDWSPDDKTIVYDMMTYTANGSERIYLNNLETPAEKQFSPEFKPGLSIHPVFSPTGDQVAYFSDLTGTNEGPYTLMVQTVNGGEPRKLGVYSQVQALGWSPDGQQVVFAGGQYPALQVIVVNVTSGEVLVIANGSQPSWQP